MLATFISLFNMKIKVKYFMTLTIFMKAQEVVREID